MWRSKAAEIGQYIGQYIEESVENRINRNVYYMNFTLKSIYDQSDNSIVHDTKESSPHENDHNDDYNEMITVNKINVVSSVDTKRMNKTMVCPKCGKSMNRKTLLYSHDCEKIKQPIIKSEPRPIEITEQDVHDYLLKQEVVSRDTLMLQRKERFDKMMSRAF